MALTPSEMRRRKMNLLMAMSYAAFASSKASAWSPTLLFAAGEQGAWYDPSDFSTMFQNSAGTTPVTAVEQPVGLLLDKSKGLALGAEIYVGLQTGTWIAGSSTITGENTYVTSSTVGPYKADILTIGKWYKITYDIAATSSNAIRFVDSAVPSASPTIHTTSAGGGTGTFYFAASSTGLYLRSSVAVSSTVTINSLSIRELPGNHASQSTAASRPVLSARVNLLTRSEEFDNAVWAKDGATVDANAGASPTGATTADKLIEGTTVNGSNHRVYFNAGLLTGTYTIVALAKAAGRTKFHVRRPDGGDSDYVLFDLSAVSYTDNTGGVASASITPLGAGWYRCSVTATCVATAATFVHICLHADNGNRAYTGDGVSGILLGGADLRVTNVGVGLPAYQRVGAAVTATTNPAVTGVPDYDTSGFPLYLNFDGVDDSLATGSIDFSATDKMSVFAGVRKLSDAALGAVMSLGDGSSIAGYMQLFARRSSGTGGYWWRVFNTSNAALDINSTLGYAAPETAILTGSINASAASGSQIIGRRNAAQVAIGGSSLGNFVNQPLRVGARQVGGFHYNGNLYSLIVRGAQSTDAQIASTETYVNNLTKAY